MQQRARCAPQHESRGVRVRLCASVARAQRRTQSAPSAALDGRGTAQTQKNANRPATGRKTLTIEAAEDCLRVMQDSLAKWTDPRHEAAKIDSAQRSRAI
jgi:hypothetical protein